MKADRRRLVVAVDGSPAATAAVEVALEIAAAMGESVLLVHAVSPLAEELFAAYPEDGPPLDAIVARDSALADAYRKAEAQGLEAAVEILAEEGGSVELATVLAGIAAGAGASMIVTGSRGRSTVAGAALGSVSHGLIACATVPVLVVHGPARDRG